MAHRTTQKKLCRLIKSMKQATSHGGSCLRTFEESHEPVAFGRESIARSRKGGLSACSRHWHAGDRDFAQTRLARGCSSLTRFFEPI